MSWLLAFDCSATAVREPLVDIGKALEEPRGDVRRTHADHLLVGLDLFTAPSREARRGRDRVGQRHERDAHRGDEQGNDVAGARPRQRGRGNPLRQGADRGHALAGEPEHSRCDGGADDPDQHRGQPSGEAGEHQQEDEHGDADDERRRLRLVEVVRERAQLPEERIGVRGETEQLRQLADDDRDRKAVHVSDLHLL